MVLPESRASVRGIPVYVPGRPTAPSQGRPTYRLSANENPYPPLPGVLEVAVEAVARLNRYPDMANTDLYAALGARFDVEPQRLVAATGSVALIYQLIHAFCDPGDEIVHAWRSFEAYPIAAAAGAATSVKVPLTAEGRHDLPAMAAAVTDRTRVIFACTPNNPTGPALTHTELEALLAAVPKRVLVVLDEAYLEFVRMTDAVDGLRLAAAHPNVVLLRTFSKAYGLAGLRLGYAVAAPPIAAALRAISLPFGVSGVAQAAAVASLHHEPALLARVDALVGERDRVVAGLASAGWRVPEPQGNFVWFQLGDATADFAARAEAAGLMVRAFAGEGCRVTVGEPEANDALIALATASW